MSAASMLGRVAKMEGGRRGVVVVWKHSDETEDFGHRPVDDGAPRQARPARRGADGLSHLLAT